MQKVLFACPQMADLAKRIKQEKDDLVLGNIEWHAFKDGFPDLRIEHIRSLRDGGQVTFLASFDNPADIFPQLSVIYWLTNYAQSLRIVLPYFPTGTMERVEEEGKVSTADTLARMISATPPRCPTEIVIYDVHELSERSFFGDNIRVRLESGILQLKEALGNRKVTIAFPDEGSYRRFRRFFTDYDQIIFAKVRDGDKRVLTIREGDPQGKDILIVDDLVQTGQTLSECTHLLYERGPRRVDAYCTHAILPGNARMKFVGLGTVTKFYITDSCPNTAKELQDQKPFEVLSLAKNIAGLL